MALFGTTLKAKLVSSGRRSHGRLEKGSRTVHGICLIGNEQAMSIGELTPTD